jgi:hypothetical protein
MIGNISGRICKATTWASIVLKHLLIRRENKAEITLQLRGIYYEGWLSEAFLVLK